MTQPETTSTAASDDGPVKKLVAAVKENGSEEAAPGHVAEVEQGTDSEKAVSTEAVKDSADLTSADKPAASDITEGEKAAEEPAVTANGNGNGDAPADAPDDNPVAAAEPIAGSAPESAADDAGSSAPGPADTAAVAEPLPAEVAPVADALPAGSTTVDAPAPHAEEASAPAAAAEPKSDDQTAEVHTGIEGGDVQQSPPQQPQEEEPQQEESQVEAEQEATKEEQQPEPEQQQPELASKVSEAQHAAEAKAVDEQPAEKSGEEKPDAKVSGEAKAEAVGSSEPVANGTPALAEAADAAASDTPATLVSPGTVQALTRRLSSNSLQGQQAPTTPPAKAPPAEKGLPPTATAVAAVGAPAVAGKTPKSPTAPRSGEASPLSTHDSKNTINVSQLIKIGAFKMQPLKDFVPYAELLRLRIEDGIDATRKEDYLNDDDFQQVFGMDRDAFKKQPAWRQQAAKKKANLF